MSSIVIIGLMLALTVIDGDTLKADGESLRLAGIDAPELRGGCASEIYLARLAKAELARLVDAAADAEIERLGKDRYGRTLARIRFDGRDAGQALIAAGVAREWRGKRSWCATLKDQSSEKG